jgi:hypothetical protein
MRRSSAFSGLVVVVLFGLLGCGSSESSSGGADGALPGGGKTSASGGAQGSGTGGSGMGAGGSTNPGATDGTGGAGGTNASCPGPNPAAANCLQYSASSCVPPRCTNCVPSHCSCVTESEVPGWECTADCRTDLPMCPDGGAKPDTALVTVDAGIASPPDAPVLGPDAADATVSCPGPNPANVACRSSATACVPSACGCVSSSGVLGWQCTADCRTSIPLCPDAGTTSDAGVVPDTRPASDSGSPRTPCGNTLCASGESCCNLNCGLCAPSGGGCTKQLCEPPTAWACTNDSDCTAVDDYCGGCNCQVLGPKGQLGTCTKGLVNCFVAPCASKGARCENGQCTLVSR